MMNYTTHGVCSRAISFEVKDNKVTDVHFVGGCSGNTQGVAALVEGMDIDEAIKRLKGIKCGHAQLPARISWQLHYSSIKISSKLRFC